MKKKILENLEYLIEIFTVVSKVAWTSQEKSISIIASFAKAVIYTLKMLSFTFNATTVDFFLIIISTYLVVGKVLVTW